MNIDSEQEYREAVQALSHKSRPPAILCHLMRTLEGYRAARKMGWSRPWNKYGVVNFQAFRLDFTRDEPLVALAAEVLDSEAAQIPGPAREFADDLLSARDDLMGFMFVHEVTEEGGEFEGATLSLGRLASEKPRHRDRLDLVMESPVSEGQSKGFDRLRIFVDPYRGRTGPLWTTVREGSQRKPTQTLFEHLALAAHDWVGDVNREWDHWTSAYVDYFGPRQWSMRNSFFPVPESVSCSASS